MGHQVEAKFWRNSVKPFLDNELNCVYFRIENQVGRGEPDVFICLRGLFVTLELKRSQKDADKNRKGHALQNYTAAKINKNGGRAYITYPENWKVVSQELIDLQDQTRFIV